MAVAPSALRFFPSSPSARFAAANPLPPRRVLPILSLRAGSLPMSTNVGVHDGAPGAAVDAAFARRALQAEALLGYLSALATSPRAGGDRVDPAVTAAQLGALGRWKGSARGLPEYTVVHDIDGVVIVVVALGESKPSGGGRSRPDLGILLLPNGMNGRKRDLSGVDLA
ncbi:hypothetical protein Zm00014a_037776 [Zea mays]|uniref:Uncharacterized protein n=1 Tax=Zea mays TaxID=4577 RepID=A0A3L6DYR5_MAIZE|nr:hypothetical protein Zm00014a_037776 [Zea mays]